MTIIACSRQDRIMIGDTVIVSDEYRFRNAYSHKIVKCQDGSLAGASGDSAACLEFLDWAMAGREKRAPATIWKADKNAEGLIFTVGSEILWFCGPVPEKIINDAFGIGYGAQMFAAATMAGAPLRRAVEIVCALSGACGGPFTELALP